MKAKTFLVAAFILFAISFLIFNFFGLDLLDLVLLPSVLQESITNQEISLGEMGSKFLVSFISAFLLSLGILFVGIYSLNTKEEEHLVKRNVSIVSSVLVILGFFIYGFSFSYLFFSVSFIISCVFSALYYKTVMEELKRWKSFRSGYKVIANTFTIIAFVFAIGVFLHGTAQSSYYADEFASSTGAFSTDSEIESIDGFDKLTEEQQQRMLNQTESKEENVRKILPIYQALSVFFVMIGLKPVLGPVSGLFSTITMASINRKN